MKDKLKRIPFLKKFLYFLKKINFLFIYIDDYKFYIKNFINSKSNENKIKYEILLIVHSIEKGMTNSNPRPFGKTKIKDLCSLIEKYELLYQKNCFEIEIAINVLREYLKFYEKNNFLREPEYDFIKEYLKKYINIKRINMETRHLNINEISTEFDYEKFLYSRHSIRKYSNKKISEKEAEKAANIAIHGPSACNRQMCKVYYIESEKNKDIIKLYGQGFGNFDLENANFFLITFDMSAFYTIGERNQGWLNSGIFATNFINALHSLGIGSCMIQFGNSNKDEKKIKKKLNINTSERIAVIISAGYYLEDNIVPASPRKNSSDYFYKR